MRTGTRTFEILIAEDSSADVGLVREALKEHGVDCVLHVFADGAQAIAWLNRLDADPRTPTLDLVLVDMHLPKRSGEDILNSLRSTERYAQVPVIVMTGLHSSSVEEKAGKYAAVSYFSKPATLDGFLSLGLIIRNVLIGEDRRARRQADSAGKAACEDGR